MYPYHTGWPGYATHRWFNWYGLLIHMIQSFTQWPTHTIFHIRLSGPPLKYPGPSPVPSFCSPQSESALCTVQANTCPFWHKDLPCHVLPHYHKPQVMHSLCTYHLSDGVSKLDETHQVDRILPKAHLSNPKIEALVLIIFTS
jgi:hypothetical protein